MAIFMKGISRYILTMLVPFLCLSCTDEIPMPAGCGAAGGVDRGKTVRVSLPFSVSGGIRSDIVTRAAGTEDSRLGRIMLFMYENKGKDQSQNKLLGYISRKTKCSTFAKHFVPKSHLLTQFKM